jgi:hypothetical protein
VPGLPKGVDETAPLLVLLHETDAGTAWSELIYENEQRTKKVV